MRSINFRAWNPKLEEMIFNPSLAFNENGLQGVYHEEFAGDGEAESNPNWEGRYF